MQTPLCPFCGVKGNFRYSIPKGTIYSCLFCRIHFTQFLSQKAGTGKIKPSYEKTYFTTEYKEQYGSTYLEDKPNIEKLARIRLARLKQVMGNELWEEPELLSLCDLGSAYGFFLNEAKKSGIGTLNGVEISKFASSYCREEFKIGVSTQSLENWLPKEKVDIISMFYVLEHFPEQESLLGKVKRALNPGGFLILALPSTHGPHFRFNRQDWLNNHPDDHFVDFNPAGIKRILKTQGFRVLGIFSSGLKTERMPGKFFIKGQSGMRRSIWRSLIYIAKFYKFGDTMEVYAQKIG